MGIRLGVNAWVWTSPFTTEHLDLLYKAKELGFGAFEFPLEDPAAIDAGKAREIVDQTGLLPVCCGAFGPGRDLAHEDPAIRAQALDYIRQCIIFCERIGAGILAGPMYSAVGKRRHVPPETRTMEWKRAVDGLGQAARFAAEHGVVLGIEPLNRFETDMVNTTAQALKMIQQIDHPAVGVHLDTFHMNIEEHDLGAAIRHAGKKLVHLHACENDRGAPGSGQVDWKGLKQALTEIEYAGAVVIESFTPQCKVIAAAAAIWRPLAVTQDRLASDGLRFLNGLLAS